MATGLHVTTAGVVFNNPGVGDTDPNAGLPISVRGASGSTGNPANDLNRRVSGTVSGSSATITNPA